MEIIGVILFILFFIVGIGDSRKKRAQNAAKSGTRRPSAATAAKPGRGPQRPQRSAPASAIPKSLDDIKGAMNQWFEDTMDEIRADVRPTVQPAAQAAQGTSMLEDPECAGGSMPHAHVEGHSDLEDEDCAGGSMAHTHTEGVSRAAQARRMAAMDATRQEDDDILPQSIDARALRRAVVMAEVLGKPRALRKS